MKRCIDSINNQIFHGYELLISDGMSSDGTLQFLESGIARNLVWYRSTPDSGIYDSLNRAMEHANGRWVLVLGCDDVLSDAYSLARAFDLISDHDDSFGIIYSDLFIRDSRAIKLKKYPEIEAFDRAYDGGACIHHQTAFIRREIMNNVGNFSSRYKFHSDYELILKIRRHSRVAKINGAFVVFSVGGSTSLFKNLPRSIIEVIEIRRSYGFFAMPVRLAISYLNLVIGVVLNYVNIIRYLKK